MCRHVRDDAEAVAIARWLADRATAEPFVTAGVDVLVRLSIGVTVARAGERASDVASHAESAAERVRSSGGGSVAAYRHEMRDAALHRLHTRSGLRRALEQGELEVYYQPQFTLADRRPFGAEALLRWRDPEHGLRGPGEFIAVAEETGLIAPIGLFVLDQACADLLTWGASADGSPGPVVSVNVSMRQLADPDLPQSVEAALAASGVAPESLCLEVTETVAMETAENMVRVLGDLQRLGVRLALDDFGTGYSSLSYLDRLPIDVLKLDRTFVAGVDHDARKRRIVAAVTGLAQGLGMRWLAEGVEREEEADALEGLGCELVQGFLFGRPAPAAETRELFARGWT
jgi:EAL domain-containing protein (putative c-di-GMP-specific phosphodiesterase class I)